MSRARRLSTFALGFALLGTFLAAWVAHDWILTEAPATCAYRRITGLSCCFCGLTRSFAHATHGELAQAREANPGWWVAVLVTAGLGVAFILAALLDRDILKPLGRTLRRWWWLLLLAVIVLTALRRG